MKNQTINLKANLKKTICFFRHRPAQTFYKMTAEWQHTAFQKLVACLLLSPANYCLLILLFLLTSGDVHPKTGPIFPSSVCAGNVTWQGRSVQSYNRSKWVHLRCSLLSFSKFRTLGCSHTWSFPPRCIPVCNIVTSSSGMYTSTVQPGPLLLMLHSHLTLVFKPPIPFLLILCLLPLLPSHCLLLLAVSLYTSCFLFPPSPSRFFNGMLAIPEPRALNFYTFFCFILLTLSVSRNPILTHLPLSGFLESLLCDLIAPTPDLAFSLLVPWIFIRQGLSFTELFTSPFSLLDLYSDYVGVNISLNNSSLLSFLNVYTPPICIFPTNGRTDSFSHCILPSSKNLFILRDFSCHHPSRTQKVLPTPVGRKHSIGSSSLTSSPSVTLT